MQTVFIMFNYDCVIIYHLSGGGRDASFALRMRVFADVFRVFFVPAAHTYGLFIFPHKIFQQIRDDCPLQGRRDCIKLIRKDKGGHVEINE